MKGEAVVDSVCAAARVALLLTVTECRLLAPLLERACDTMGNAGCNDFAEYETAFESDAEREAFTKMYHDWNGDPQDYCPGDMLPDFAVLGFFASRVHEAAQGNPTTTATGLSPSKDSENTNDKS